MRYPRLTRPGCWHESTDTLSPTASTDPRLPTSNDDFLMHRLPNKYSVLRFRFAALLLLAKWALIVGSAAVLGDSLFVGNQDLTRLAIALMALAVLAMLAQWLFAARSRCPLCVGHPMAHKSCAIHRDARRLFGSYRLQVALYVVFQGWFRCPFCGESTAIEVRRQRH